MKKLSIIFLKLSIIMIMTPIFLLGAYGLFWLARNPVHPEYAAILYPVLAGIYLSLIPLIISAVYLYKLLKHASDNTLTILNRKNILNKLKKTSIVFGLIYVAALPFVFQVAQKDDAPGLILFFCLPIFLAMISYAITTLFLDVS